MRTVKIYSTKTQRSQTISSSATTWGELRDQILAETSALNEDMTATVFETKNTLISPSATLPSGNFTLALTPAKTKSGAIDVAAIMASLRDEINEAFSNLLERIEDGEFGEMSESDPDISAELKNFKLD